MAEAFSKITIVDESDFNVRVSIADQAGFAPRTTVIKSWDFGPAGPAGPPGALSPMRFPVWIPEKPGPAEVIFRVISTEAFHFTPNTCHGLASNSTTANATFTVSVGAANVGTISFSTGSNTAVIAFTNTACPANTVFGLTAPFLVDTTLAGISITLTGQAD